MSILKNKHNGWTWRMERHFNGGGGSWNPVDIVSDAISSVGDAVSDVAQSVGNGLAEVDTFVNNEVPGGWVTVGLGVATAGYLTAEQLAAEGAIAAGAEVGPTIAELGAEAATTGAELAGPTAAELGVPTAVTPTPAADAILSGTTAPVSGTGSAIPEFGTLNPALPSAGSVGGAGAGLSAELPAGTILGTGLPSGGEIGASYTLGANGLPATDLLGNYIPASSVNFGGIPANMGITASDLTDAAKNANRIRQLSNLLSSTSGKTVNLPANLPNPNQWTQQAAQNYAQATPAQFGGSYNMNQNPFTFVNPLANALKTTNPFDVSGTSGGTLNTTGQTQNLANLLK